MSKLILFNKPFNVLSQFTDDAGRDTLKRYLPNIKDCYPAGRLDYDSEGLLLLTDNGTLQHRISHPAHKLAKTYWVQVEGQPRDEDLKPLQQGILLSDGPCLPAQVSRIAEPQLWPRNPPVRQRQHIPTAWLEITITEGRNRQVRRMTAAAGFPTLRLVRVRIGSWNLDGINPGQYQELQVHAPQTAKKTTKQRPKNKNSHKRHTTKRGRRL
ncbi:pseudouridine synthase [Dasania sp. GY-MA-18]|uniref:Pseudouridine synthase n=1 Tax=Dasania phycosphaerae TaxID=2950436 RepID=A0A9J6RJU0_9GAMM|nr:MULTISPECIES: pseudouridine synthase [Dasania]MCR8921825.1 pseudouridine synthase [Dasania sp. GY-MA-18]MCZ0864253.1 pseudouridine synthase [Dasania phycosphaerae]MCZ0867981.1 pseudouridine synthase [Dasania phycosphaerae]